MKDKLPWSAVFALIILVTACRPKYGPAIYVPESVSMLQNLPQQPQQIRTLIPQLPSPYPSVHLLKRAKLVSRTLAIVS